MSRGALYHNTLSFELLGDRTFDSSTLFTEEQFADLLLTVRASRDRRSAHPSAKAVIAVNMSTGEILTAASLRELAANKLQGDRTSIRSALTSGSLYRSVRSIREVTRK